MQHTTQFRGAFGALPSPWATCSHHARRPLPPGAHFYCETLDVTRPFPSASPVASPSWDFVWNRWLGCALRRTRGLEAVVPALLQGVCGAHELWDDAGAPYTLLLVSRRSCMHAGPRYKGEQVRYGGERGRVEGLQGAARRWQAARVSKSWIRGLQA
eukprot:40845-Chlamydomonas_euryale.AAC.4